MTTRDKLTFVHAMARHTCATVRQCEALMRYAGTYRRTMEWERCEPHKAARYQAKRLRMANKIGELCRGIEGAALVPVTGTLDVHKACRAVFDGPVVRIRVPEDEGEGICVPS